MKYVIILYLCSFVNVEPVCYSEKIVALEFNNYKPCILEGYKQAFLHLEKLDDEKVNKEQLTIRFNCKKIKMENI